MAITGITSSAFVASLALVGPLNTWLIWLVFITFNVPIIGFLVVVPFGRRLNEALKEKSNIGFGMGSYSRITGAIGAVILTAFFWAIGNVILIESLRGRGNLTQLLDTVGRFFLMGSALFLPYAFNQLKTIFPWATGSSAATPPQPTTSSPVVDSVTKVTIANVSSLSDAEVQHAVQAIATQVTQDFAAEWKASASLDYRRLDLSSSTVPLDSAPDAVIYFGDTALDPNKGHEVVYGYHARAHGSIPYGFVYLDVCKKYGEAWSVTLSHEVLELLADPTAVMLVDGPLPEVSGITVHYALEVCDATQGDTYLRQGVEVCNFVNKAFFGLPGGSPKLNHLGLQQTPFSPRPKGYVTYYDDITDAHQSWGPDVTSSQKAARSILGMHRRNGRRNSRLSKVPDRMTGSSDGSGGTSATPTNAAF